METMINLTDLLKHEIMDLYSAEEQIIEALPKMVQNAKNPELKKALREHLKVTEDQKSRLDKVKQTFGEGDGQNGNKGFFSRLFGGGSGGEKCKGMEGLITEGEKIMKADITDEALDAAIIASAQKIEHYEICGYGTARAFARELKLTEVERLLTQTLNEEYAADDLLTSLAVGKLNQEAEQADGMSEVTSDSSVSATNGTGKTSSEKKSSKNSNTSKAVKSTGGSSKSKSSSSKGAIKSFGGRVTSTNSKSTTSNNGASRGGSKSAGSGSSKGVSKSASTSSANRGSSKSASKGVSKSPSKNSSKESKNSAKSKGAKKAARLR